MSALYNEFFDSGGRRVQEGGHPRDHMITIEDLLSLSLASPALPEVLHFFENGLEILRLL